MRVKGYLNDDDQEFVKELAEYVISKKKLGEWTSSGYYLVMRGDDADPIEVYRMVGEITNWQSHPKAKLILKKKGE